LQRPVHLIDLGGGVDDVNQQFGGNVSHAEEQARFVLGEKVEDGQWIGGMDFAFVDAALEWAVVNDANGGGEGGESLELISTFFAEAIEKGIDLGGVLGGDDEEGECAGEAFVGTEEFEELDAPVLVRN
jgi:hypothetical protein